MNFKFDNNSPIYLQLVEDIKLQIISGNIKKGDKLLSVRELALTKKVNPNTMQKALVELENMKLIYTERTNGKYVTNDEKIINKIKKEFINTKINTFINDMNSIGLDKNEIVKYLQELYKEEKWQSF